MDSVTDICKYHLLCFVTIIQVKVISGHQVKKVKQFFFRDLELQYMFLGQIFAKNAKHDPKTLFEASKSVKKQSSENYGKVPKWREKRLFLTCFLLYLSHFWRYRLEILYTYSWDIALYHMLRFLENSGLGGNCLEKKKRIFFWKIFEIFKILKIRDSSFVALLIIRHFI